MLKLHLGHIDALDKAITDIEKEVGSGFQPFQQAAKLLSSMRASRGQRACDWPRSASTCRARHTGHLLSWSCLSRATTRAPASAAAPGCAPAASGSRPPCPGRLGGRSGQGRLSPGAIPSPPCPTRAKKAIIAVAASMAHRRFGTCCATARNGTTSAPPTSDRTDATRPPPAWCADSSNRLCRATHASFEMSRFILVPHGRSEELTSPPGERAQRVRGRFISEPLQVVAG